MPHNDDNLGPIRDRLSRAEMDIADNRHGIVNAKEVFEIKLGQVATSIEELKNILKWAGGLIVTLMISFMTWSALQQYNANEAQKADLQQQVDIIKSQETAQKDREEMLRQLQKDLGTSGTVSTVTTNSVR